MTKSQRAGSRERRATRRPVCGMWIAASLMFAFSGVFAQPVTADIERYEVSGNTLLSPLQVEQVLGLLPRRVTFDDIQRAAQELQQAYRAAGYGAVIVQIPEQDLQQGLLRFQVFEGKLAQVQVTGQQTASRDTILSSVPALVPGHTPNLKALDSQLLMANENPGRTVRVIFQPGEQSTDVEALVVVEELPLRRWQWVLDNTGNSATGHGRLSLGYQQTNLFNRDAVLGVNATVSPTKPSKVQIVGTTLRVPLYTHHVFLEGSLLSSNTSNAVNSTPAGELRFSGKGHAIGMRALWLMPSLGEVKSRAALGVDARRYRNECSLGEFGAAGCGSAAASVDVLPLSFGLQAQRLGAWSAHAEYVANLPWGSAGRNADFDANRTGARSNYRLVRAGAQVQHSVTPKWSVGWRVDSQWAMTPLVPAEQFGSGGASTVRGYHERSLNTDSGVNTSLEVRTPLSSLVGSASGSSEPTVSAFVDAASASNRIGAECSNGHTRCSIWSFGVGAALRPSDRSLIRIELARAGRAAGATAAGDWRLHVSLNHSL